MANLENTDKRQEESLKSQKKPAKVAMYSLFAGMEAPAVFLQEKREIDEKQKPKK